MQLFHQARQDVARYLIFTILAALAACTYSSGEQHEAGTFPETRTPQVAVSEVSEPARYVAPGEGEGLSGFAHRVSLTDGERVRMQDFEVLCHAPNRHPGVAAPYL